MKRPGAQEFISVVVKVSMVNQTTCDSATLREDSRCCYSYLSGISDTIEQIYR